VYKDLVLHIGEKCAACSGKGWLPTYTPFCGVCEGDTFEYFLSDRASPEASHLLLDDSDDYEDTNTVRKIQVGYVAKH
jgi:hypothetical protein